MIPRYRIFFYASVYIAALLSPQGAAGELVRLAESGSIGLGLFRKWIEPFLD
ncbi:MAG: hypothetical protein HY747_01080 [Elusimicrobia bacterium]|nr:hypothetical protein [Elusimicrobiota bacterium]